jgi:transcriptional regulator GlxA family with amidase domain
LHDHFDTELKALRELMEAHFAAHQMALKLANDAMEKRLEGMNEFREALREQAASFVRRTEMDVARDSLELRVRSVETRFAWLVGYMVGSGVCGGVLGAELSKVMG